MTLGAPYTDVRVVMPHNWHFVEALLPLGLDRIILRPPATGPEIELGFGTPAGTEYTEEYIRSEIEKRGLTVLAIRQRGEAP